MLKGLKTEVEEEMNTATFPSVGRLLASLIQGWGLGVVGSILGATENFTKPKK